MVQVKKFEFDQSFDTDKPNKTKLTFDDFTPADEKPDPSAKASGRRRQLSPRNKRKPEKPEASPEASEEQAKAEPTPPPPPPPPPTFSEAEMEAARNAAREEGRQMGQKEAAAATEQQLADALAGLANALPGLFAEHEKRMAEFGEEAAGLAVAITRKICPELGRRNALEEIGGLVRSCLESAVEAPKVVAFVHPEMVEPAKEKIDALLQEQGFEGRLLVNGDDALTPPDCRLEWGQGGTELVAAALWQQVDAAVARFLADGVDGTDGADGAEGAGSTAGPTPGPPDDPAAGATSE